ncbi:MAG: rhomboid family intramembrane serine protease [Balneolales bacterium]|nr:rhomboid family intramembrane serine protease [Balneolales bacterium]
MWITYYIIILTTAISWYAWNMSPKLQHLGMLRPYLVFREDRWYQLISSGFLHANLTHLLFNMVTLFFFGPVVERSIGTGYFIGLYVASLLLSSIPSLFRHRNNPSFASLGASGAVGAVLFAFIYFFPMEPIYILFIPIGIPAVFFGFAFIGYSFWAHRKASDQINHEAHIAGAVAGLLYVILIVPRGIDHLLTLLGLI